MLFHLDLFSGIGGFALAARMVGGYRTIGFCEIEPYCQAVLRKHWPGVPIYDDVRSLSGRDTGPVDVITGGFPCQDISSAGNKVGIDGARSGLWKELARIIGELRPRYALMENVTDLLARGMGEVLGDLSALGYDAEWHCLPACYVGSPQPRDRVWIVAYPSRGGRSRRSQWHGKRTHPERWLDDDGLALAKRRAGEAASRIRRMDDGLPRGVDRLRGLGNAIVPQVAAIFLQAIKEVSA